MAGWGVFSPAVVGRHAGLVVERHADRTPGSIPASIARFLMMQDTKERRMREKSQQSTLIGAFKMKAGLQAVRRASGGEEKEGEI